MAWVSLSKGASMHRLIATGLLSLSLALIVQAAPPATQPTTSPATTTASAISWDQAAKHVGATLAVTGPVVGTHKVSSGRVVLNVGKDFPDASRFTVFMAVGDDHTDPDSTYKGKTISVTGKIELYHDVAEIRAKAADVKIQK
jgi:hypothetical protein